MSLFGSPSGLAAVQEKTRRDQAAAADPMASAWVSANAGTGKTHVLTMRVLRLLLDGVEPERILALTYTKAAAAEMSTRVFDRLAEWVTADHADLKSALAGLLDGAPSSEVMLHARRLFARAIETPGGLKVRLSTPSASDCCSASRSRPACRPALKFSTTSSGRRCSQRL